MEKVTLKAADCLAMNLKMLREAKEWSLNDLAKETGLTKQSIWNFENGERFPSSDALASIAKTFGIEETDLFDPAYESKLKKKK